MKMAASQFQDDGFATFCRHIKFCKQNTAMLIDCLKIYSARHQQDTKRTQNRAGL